MKTSKRYITLLELIIAMSLTILIITTMTYFFRQINQINLVTDKLQAESFEKRFLENRLMASIPKAVKFNTQEEDFVFFTTQDTSGLVKPGTQSLLFTFDNCVNLDPEFSSHVLGRLYLDPENRLILSVWPSYVRWIETELPPVKKEVLLEGVTDIEFAFFVSPKKEKKSLGLKKPQVKLLPDLVGEWQKEWKKEDKQLPAIVKIILTLEEEKWMFAVPIPNHYQPIVYDR